MITKLRRRLTAHGSPEGGLSLIEVMVAMVIFTVISVGVLYTMMNLLSVTRDSRNRQVAANLAAQEIDLARDVNDIFNVTTYSHDVSLNGDTFTVTRKQEWVYSTGGAAACGAGSGALRYKYVEVEVEWDGMRAATGVKSETFINPNARINDPAKGTLIISVTTAAGEGVSGVPITATPVSGSTLTATTDSDGCAFILGVAPNTFTVKISSPAASTYVDISGVQEPTQPATVVAGTSASVPFTYDKAGTLNATYGAAGLLVPINLNTTLFSTRDAVNNTATVASNPRSFLVSPWPDGYSVVAGRTADCRANDPSLWTASGLKANGEKPAAVATESAVTTNVVVPMIGVTVTGMSATGTTNRYLVAVSNSVTTAGQPNCLTQQILRFAQTSTTTMNIALPYGTWELHKGSSTTFTPSGSTKIGSGITAGAGGTVAGSGTVTLDPRGPV